MPLTKDWPSSVFVFHGVHSFGSGARGALRKEAGAITCVHTAYRYSVFGGLVRPSGRPRPGRPKALVEHWQGRTWLSRGSKNCNTVSVGELGEDPPTGLWAYKFAPFAAGARRARRWGLAWWDEVATMAQQCCVLCSCTACIWMWKIHSNTFFFCILCLRFPPFLSNSFW